MKAPPAVIAAGAFFVCLLFLAGHDVKDHLVGDTHGVGTDDRQVADRAVHIIVNDALGTGDMAALHSEHGAKQGSGDARRDFQ